MWSLQMRWEVLEAELSEVYSVIIHFHFSILFSADLYLIIPQMENQSTQGSASSKPNQNSEDNVIHGDYSAWTFYIRKKYLLVSKGNPTRKWKPAISHKYFSPSIPPFYSLYWHLFLFLSLQNSFSPWFFFLQWICCLKKYKCTIKIIF